MPQSFASRWIQLQGEAGKGKCKARAIRVDRSEKAFKELLTKVNSLALVRSDACTFQARLSEVRGRISKQQQSRDESLVSAANSQ